MNDLIERQLAIDIVEFECGEWRGLAGTIVKAIEQLPSVQPEPKWIPCDKRMPEEHEWIGTRKFGTTMSEEVYVTFENSKGERFTKHLHFYNGELSRYEKTYMDAWYKDCKPIAWMPLPDPYKGGEK